MKVIQIWLGGDFPYHIRKCMERTKKYAQEAGFEYVLYTDKEHLGFEDCSVEVPQYIIDIVDKCQYKSIATRVDYIRYLLLRDCSVNTTYVDSDMVFLRNPFGTILKGEYELTVSSELTRSKSGNVKYWNGLISAKPGCLQMRTLVDNVAEFIESKGYIINNYLAIGPEFLTWSVKDSEGLQVLDMKVLLGLSFGVCLQCAKDETYARNKVRELLDGGYSYSFHMYKHWDAKNSEYNNKVLARWIDIVEEEIKNHEVKVNG